MHGWRSSECAILSLGVEHGERCDHSRKILEHLLPHICLALQRTVRDQIKVPAQLTRREYEVLSWIAAGKTAWETSEILKISRRTVEFHMATIRKKLDAVTSQQAIAIAIFHRYDKVLNVSGHTKSQWDRIPHKILY